MVAVSALVSSAVFAEDDGDPPQRGVDAFASEQPKSSTGNVFLLLLRPSERIFEFVPITYGNGARTTVSDLLRRIPRDTVATDSVLGMGELSRHPSEKNAGRSGSNSDSAFGDLLSDLRKPSSAICAGIRRGEVLVALPGWCPPDQYLELAGTILWDPRVVRLPRDGDAPVPPKKVPLPQCYGRNCPEPAFRHSTSIDMPGEESSFSAVQQRIRELEAKSGRDPSGVGLSSESSAGSDASLPEELVPGVQHVPSIILPFTCTGKSNRRAASGAVLQSAVFATESMKQLQVGGIGRHNGAEKGCGDGNIMRHQFERSREINESLHQFSRESMERLSSICEWEDGNAENTAEFNRRNSNDSAGGKKDRQSVSKARRVIGSITSSLGSRLSRVEKNKDNPGEGSGYNTEGSNTFQSIMDTPEFQMADEDRQMEMLIEESREACLKAILDHLELFLLETPDVTYEEWIEELHPENARSKLEGTNIDHRFYLEGSDHRKLWNANLGGNRTYVSVHDEYSEGYM